LQGWHCSWDTLRFTDGDVIVPLQQSGTVHRTGYCLRMEDPLLGLFIRSLF
jgi:hypothetical protein